MSAGKGLDVSILCHGWFPDVGGVESQTRDLARELGLVDHVVFTGYRDDVPRLAQASDALVVTSRIEAQSRTVPQAFARAGPVVASRVGGFAELVAPAERGWRAPSQGGRRRAGSRPAGRRRASLPGGRRGR